MTTENQENENLPAVEPEATQFPTFETLDGVVQPKKPEEKPAEGAEQEQEGDKPSQVGEGEPDGSPDEPLAPPKPKLTVQERINQQTRARREAERERDLLRARLEREQTGAPPAPDSDGPPDPTKYTYGELDVGYLRDTARYEARQEHSRLQREAVEQRQREAEEAQQAELRVKADMFMDAGAARYDDFETVVRAKDLPVPSALMHAVVETEHGPDIAYHLATHRDELEKLARKSPVQIIMEVARMEAKFAERAKPKAPGAPPPVNRARGAGGKFTVDGNTSDFAAFEAVAMKAAS